MYDSSLIRTSENFEIKSEPTYIFQSSVNISRGRLNSNSRGNSNYNNRNTRQGRYCSDHNSGNQIVGNKDRWGCKTNPLDNVSNMSVYLSLV